MCDDQRVFCDQLCNQRKLVPIHYLRHLLCLLFQKLSSGKILKEGDLVRVVALSSWGGRTFRSYGVLIKRTYMAYEESHSKWKVLTNKGVEVVVGKCLSQVAV